MYKTIRHGENSLQYTILPQNDDFRVEGKLSSAESTCSSRRSKKSKRPKRRSFFAYLGLIFVCTVIVGAVLIPFLVSAECLPSPTEWFLKTKAAFSKSDPNPNIKHINHNNRINKTNELPLTKQQKQLEPVLDQSANIGKHVKLFNKHGVDHLILQLNKTNKSNTVTKVTASTEASVDKTQISADIVDKSNPNQSIPTNDVEKPTNGEEIDMPVNSNIEHVVTEIRFNKFNNNPENSLDTVMPTLVVTTVRSPASTSVSSEINKDSLDPIKPKESPSTTTRPTVTLSITSNVISPPRVPANTIVAQNASSGVLNSIPTITTRIIQVPLLKSAAKQPIIPGVLAKNPTQNDFPAGAVEKSPQNEKNRSKWIERHWPFIDPSTYLQWTGLKTENSVLLPALLGFALIGIILSITVCLVARNKRTIVSSVRKRNRNDIEETGTEDNATLLTATNLSDED